MRLQENIDINDEISDPQIAAGGIEKG